MKVLCIHGWLSSPEFLKAQLAGWQSALTELDFVYYRGRFSRPIHFNLQSHAIRRFHQENKLRRVYAHFDGEVRYYLEGFPLSENLILEALNDIINILNTEKDIGGIIGVHQGAFLADFFLTHRDHPVVKSRLFADIKRPFFVIFVSYPYLSPGTKMLDIASLHVYAEDDPETDNPFMAMMHYFSPLKFVTEDVFKPAQSLIQMIRKVIVEGSKRSLTNGIKL